MFHPVPVHVGFVVRNVALGLVFLLVVQIHPVIVFPSIERTNSHLIVTFMALESTQPLTERVPGLFPAEGVKATGA
jgi:hypothetical protein